MSDSAADTAEGASVAQQPSPAADASTAGRKLRADDVSRLSTLCFLDDACNSHAVMILYYQKRMSGP